MKLKNIIFVLIVLFSCSTGKLKFDRDESSELPEMIQENYIHYIYKNNRKYLHTNIKRAEFFKKKEAIKCENLLAEIFNSKGEKTTMILSDIGNIDQKEKLVEFNGNVKIQNIDNETTIYTEQLFLDYKNNKMYNNVDVRIEKDDGSYLKATSMVSDISTKESTYTNMEIKYFYESDDENEDNKE